MLIQGSLDAVSAFTFEFHETEQRVCGINTAIVDKSCSTPADFVHGETDGNHGCQQYEYLHVLLPLWLFVQLFQLYSQITELGGQFIEAVRVASP